MYVEREVKVPKEWDDRPSAPGGRKKDPSPFPASSPGTKWALRVADTSDFDTSSAG